MGRKYQIKGRCVLKEQRAIEECLGIALSSCTDTSIHKTKLRMHKTRETVIWEKLLSTGFDVRIEKL